MLPPKQKLPAEEQRLLSVFRQLPADARDSLQSYAEFLSTRVGTVVVAEPQQPLDIPRPEAESVIAAIRRLSQTFPMLDREVLLHETSTLMTAHVMQGRPANQVIDELEVVFRRHYERIQSNEE